MNKKSPGIKVKMAPNANRDELLYAMYYFGAIAKDTGVDHFITGMKWPEYIFRCIIARKNVRFVLTDM